ncbi:protein kinase [Streptomyces sp. NPDC048018]|uniref:protein kinase domain-containing protein n=1 Tax=Streptomyces sp. NPDC048018 TaxID=3365499 RepID=UPI00370FA609
MKPLEAGDPESVGDGRYRLVGRLGQGGMGVVYLGRSRSGRAVAVKVVRPDLSTDPEFRRRFAREVTAARQVGGFHTAPVVDADPDGHPAWLVTAYVPGPTLRAVLDEVGALPEDSLTVLAAGLAEALDAIHRAGVVHRDLKPANIIVAEDGPRVIDFGIARALDGTAALTRTGLQVGTPGYLAPEQLTAGTITPAVDMFALGVVLSQAAGGSPFGDGSSVGWLYRVVHEEPDLGAVPPSLREPVAACLAKDPAARPTPAAFLDALTVRHRPDGGWLPDAATRLLGTAPGLPTTSVAQEKSAPAPTPPEPTAVEPEPASGAPEPTAPSGPRAAYGPPPVSGPFAGGGQPPVSGPDAGSGRTSVSGPGTGSEPTAVPGPGTADEPTAAGPGNPPVPVTRPTSPGPGQPPPHGPAPGGPAGPPAPSPAPRPRRRVAVVAALVAAAAVAGLLVWQPWKGEPGTGRKPGGGTSSTVAGPAAFPDTQLLVREDTAPGWPRECHAVIAVRPSTKDEPRRLVPGGSCDTLPQWAPDRASFAFTRTTPEGTAVWTAKADGSDARRVAAISGGRVSWSPDGTRLAVLRKQDGVQQLFEVKVADGTVRRLTHGTGRVEDPSWSPDGSRIAVSLEASAPGDWQIHVVDPSNPDKEPRQVTRLPHPALDAVWSPDGRTFAYTAGTYQGATRGDIRLVRADGTGDRPLVRTAEHEMDPAWSADGTWLAFVRGPYEKPVIWAVRADGTGERRVTTGTAPEGHPAWR